MDTETRNENETVPAPKIIIENHVKKEEPKTKDKPKDKPKDKDEKPQEARIIPLKLIKNKREFQILAISKIVVEPGANPRKVFDREYLKELADSIRTKGILHPLIVSLREGKYVLVTGECRLRAAKIAGLTEVPVLTDTEDALDNDFTRLIENVQRRNISPMEEAVNFKKLLGKSVMRADPANPKKLVPTVMNVKAIAQAVGKTAGHISQRLSLLELHKDIQQSLMNNEINVSQARELHSAGDEKLQLKLLAKIRGADDTVRVKDIKADIDTSRAKRSMANNGKKRGRPPTQENQVAPNVTRQGLEAALEHLANVKLNLKKVTEVRELMAMVYEKFDKAKSDEKKMYFKGAIAALECATGIKEEV